MAKKMLPCGYVCVDETISVEKDGSMGGKCLSVEGSGVEGLPAYTEEDEGKVLMIVEGAPAWVTLE